MTEGERLRQWRKALGMTQQDLADHIQASRYTVGRWESGTSEPNWRVLWLALCGNAKGAE
jgi:transcriptional regulator with XRE-family HTH domain